MRNKLAQYILAVGLSLTLFNGCREVRKGLSDVLHEDALVVEMEHQNSRTTSFPTIVGKMAIMHHVCYPERNMILFDGKVDFEIDNKEIFSRFNQGDSANVSYREVYKLTFDDFMRHVV